MAQTFAEMAAERDPLYAAMKPQGEWRYALKYDEAGASEWAARHGQLAIRHNRARDTQLLILTIRALRNQNQPCYDAR